MAAGDGEQPRERLGENAEGGVMGRVLDRCGAVLIAQYLERPVAGYEPFTPERSNASQLR